MPEGSYAIEPVKRHPATHVYSKTDFGEQIMDSNQEQELSNEYLSQESPLKERLQLLADMLNETPRRKSSLSFLTSWFFGNRGVLVGLLNIVFFCIPSFFILMGWLFGFKECSGSDFGWILGCFLFGVLGLTLFIPYWKAYFLFKNGYFTIGEFTERGLVYTDSAGNQHCWIPTRFYKFSQPFMEFIVRLDDPYLVVVGKNPKKILILPAYPFSEDDGCIGFSVIMGLYAVNVTYNTQNNTFIDKSSSIWKWIIPVAIIIWTLGCGYAVFFTAK